MTTTINRILAATDLSQPSLRAVDRGFQIAQEAKAQYTVLHAVGLDALAPLRNLLGGEVESISRKIVEQQRIILESITSEPTRNRGISAVVHVEHGLATDVVPAYASTINSDLVVIGARGQGLLRRLTVGSTASRLLRKSKSPVLVVKNPCESPYRKALIPVDFSAASGLSVGLTRAVAATADIVLLHVFDVPFEGLLTQDVIEHYRRETRKKSLAQLHEIARRAGLGPDDYTAVVAHGDTVARVLSARKNHDCDLLVMGKHGTHVTEELLLGSVTKRLLSESSCDILVLVDKRGPSAEPA